MRWSASDERWGVVPRCYDEVLVCLLCSQFFHKQAEYRPSFEQIRYEERKVAFMETKRREKEYWDPLRMCEKDREREADELLRQHELEVIQSQQQLLMDAIDVSSGQGSVTKNASSDLPNITATSNTNETAHTETGAPKGGKDDDSSFDSG